MKRSALLIFGFGALLSSCGEEASLSTQSAPGFDLAWDPAVPMSRQKVEFQLPGSNLPVFDHCRVSLGVEGIPAQEFDCHGQFDLVFPALGQFEVRVLLIQGIKVVGEARGKIEVEECDPNQTAPAGWFLGAGGCFYDPNQTPIEEVPPAMPWRLGPLNEPVWFINGFANYSGNAFLEMGLMADGMRAPVVGIYNDVGSLLLKEQGRVSGLNSHVAGLVRQRLAEGGQVTLHGTSIGAQTVSQVISTLSQTLSPTELAQIRVQTSAGAQPVFPPGPQYVHYVHELDPFPGLMGVFSQDAEPGAGALIATFADITSPTCPEYRDRYRAGGWILAEPSRYPGTVGAFDLTMHDGCRYGAHFLPFDTVRRCAGEGQVALDLAPACLQP